MLLLLLPLLLLLLLLLLVLLLLPLLLLTKNWRTLLQQSFTACMPLLTTTSAFELGRRC